MSNENRSESLDEMYLKRERYLLNVDDLLEAIYENR